MTRQGSYWHLNAGCGQFGGGGGGEQLRFFQVRFKNNEKCVLNCKNSPLGLQIVKLFNEKTSPPRIFGVDFIENCKKRF